MTTLDKFSSSQLQDIRSSLESKLQNITEETEYSVDEMKKLTDDTYSDPSDRATLESDRNRDIRLRERGLKLKPKIQKAIERIDRGVYQECEECGGDIPTARMLARPVTDLCIRCKESQEQHERLSNG